MLHSEQEMIFMLVQRNQQVISILYDRYAAVFYGVIKKAVGDEAVAEALMQDTFVKIWNYGAEYSVSNGRLFTWLLHLARNTAINYLRLKNEKGIIPTDECYVTKIANARATSLFDDLGFFDLLAELKPEQQALLDLLYFGGLTEQQASEALGIPLSSVKTNTKTFTSILSKGLIGE